MSNPESYTEYLPYLVALPYAILAFVVVLRVYLKKPVALAPAADPAAPKPKPKLGVTHATTEPTTLGSEPTTVELKKAAPVEFDEAVVVPVRTSKAEMPLDIDDYLGVYRGFTPVPETKADGVPVGEMELVITVGKAQCRLADGVTVLSEEFNLSAFAPMTMSELDQIDAHLLPRKPVVGFRDPNREFPQLIFGRTRDGHHGIGSVIVRFGGTADKLGPSILFSPEAQERGEFKKAVEMIESIAGAGALPRLRNGGRAAAKPEPAAAKAEK